ncbi:hypothetical protein ACH4E7_21395 [Kitasatospora sp. NPDC018058]|uniref:hypothetical protein n=1 Tax=Kitasatospora sp. NPDC018058 TaxID=3364025 RepID=UPI0037BED2F8
MWERYKAGSRVFAASREEVELPLLSRIAAGWLASNRDLASRLGFPLLVGGDVRSTTASM